MTNPRAPRDARNLARLAEPLQPAVAPYYVATPDRPGQLVGWYVELEAGEPVPLGSNVYSAAAVVSELARQANGSAAA